MSASARFRFVVDGQEILGSVQGAGGKAEFHHLARAARLAAKGRPHQLYEPRPGCVSVFPDETHLEDGFAVIVPIATWDRAEAITPDIFARMRAGGQ